MPEVFLTLATTLTHFQQARALISTYVDWLDEETTRQNWKQEYDLLEAIFSPPGGRLLLAMSGEVPIGCVGLKPLQEVDESSCEMKRLFVLDDFKGRGVGALLVNAIVKEGAALGYRFMYLDTLEWMKPAIKLYERAGFEKIPPYNDTQLEGLVYLRKRLMQENLLSR